MRSFWDPISWEGENCYACPACGEEKLLYSTGSISLVPKFNRFHQFEIGQPDDYIPPCRCGNAYDIEKWRLVHDE